MRLCGRPRSTSIAPYFAQVKPRDPFELSTCDNPQIELVDSRPISG